MCYTKLIRYALCGHWARSFTPCDNQAREQLRQIVFLPDVELPEQCPTCASTTVGFVHLQALPVVDRFAWSDDTTSVRSVFALVEDHAGAGNEWDGCTSSVSDDEPLRCKHQEVLPWADYEDCALAELQDSPSPPQSPFGTQVWNWTLPSPTLTVSSWDGEDADTYLPSAGMYFEQYGHANNAASKTNGKNGHCSGSICVRKEKRAQWKLAEAKLASQRDREEYNNKKGNRCRMGSPRELNKLFDDQVQKLCRYHKYAQGKDQHLAPCDK